MRALSSTGGGATFDDVTELMRQVQQRVYAETGVRLEPEVRIVDVSERGIAWKS